MSDLRFLWAYSATDPAVHAWHDRLTRRRRHLGYDVESFCVTPPSVQRGWLAYSEIDRRWRRGDRELFDLYERLAARVADRDVFVLFNGAHVHPEFARMIDAVRIYHAADDPESSDVLSRPVAPAFDVAMVSNVACVDQYLEWGVPEAHFWPLGSQVTEDEVADLTTDDVASADGRPLPLFLACERVSPHRRARLDRLAAEFPQAEFVGQGWPRAYVPWDELWRTYRRTQIGWNLHNSLGPVNFRTYDLPAHGVMQICDNRSWLTRVFEVGKEVVGYDTLEECIELTRHYLVARDEQRAIALAGWERWRRDYTPDRVWARLVEVAERHHARRRSPPRSSSATLALRRQRKRASVRGAAARVAPDRLVRGIARRVRSGPQTPAGD